MEKNCPYCQKGNENEYGDIMYREFPCTLRGAIYSPKPCIFKRNNRYFLTIPNRSSIEIKACPICGRSFVEGENRC